MRMMMEMSIKNPQDPGVTIGGNHRAEWGLTQVLSPQNKIPMSYNGKHLNKTSNTYWQDEKNIMSKDVKIFD